MIDSQTTTPIHLVPRSNERFARALELIPGGTQLVSRRPSRYAAGVSPAYAARAAGARFWDIDGHEYIDWVSGIGAIILGYADPVVNDAVCRQIALGNCFSVNHELEVELASEQLAVDHCRGEAEWLIEVADELVALFGAKIVQAS